jgi:hypothetical protein
MNRWALSGHEPEEGMAVSVAWYIAMKTMASVNDGVNQGGVKI